MHANIRDLRVAAPLKDIPTPPLQKDPSTYPRPKSRGPIEGVNATRARSRIRRNIRDLRVAAPLKESVERGD